MDTLTLKAISATPGPYDLVGVMVYSTPPDPKPPPTTTRLSFPHCCLTRPTDPGTPRPLIEYYIPMDKARLLNNEAKPAFFTQGSLSDPALFICPASPTTPFKFPFLSTRATPLPTLMDKFKCPRIPMEGVQRVIGLPQVFGLHGDNGAFARVNRSASTAHTLDASAPPSMMGGGANICVAGILDLLDDVKTIPPLPILVATKTHQLLIDNCCTKHGYLPLTLDDGSIYYQECFYCKNAL
jgi:hypothetical protein